MLVFAFYDLHCDWLVFACVGLFCCGLCDCFACALVVLVLFLGVFCCDCDCVFMVVYFAWFSDLLVLLLILALFW